MGDSNYLETSKQLSQRIVNDYDGTKENLANEQVQAKKQNIGGGASQRAKISTPNSQDKSSKKTKPTLTSKVENKEKEMKDSNLNVDVPNGVMPQSVSKEEKPIKG